MDKILVDRLEFTEKDIERILKSTINGSVITHSGIGNLKDGPYGRTGVTFVVIDGKEWYIRPVEPGIGYDESRRNQERQIQAALDMDELEYYTPMDEYEFTKSMESWSRVDLAPIPDKFGIGQNNSVGTGRILTDDQVIQFIRKGPKIGRNEVCTCGSNLKYKKCCGARK